MNNSTDPTTMSAWALSEGLRGGRLKVRDVAEAFLARHALREPVVQAWTHLDPAQVRSAADRLDKAGPKGALFGLPDAKLEFFELHTEADLAHSNLGWNAVAEHAARLGMEDAVVEACRKNLVVWEHYLDGIAAAGDREERRAAA